MNKNAWFLSLKPVILIVSSTVLAHSVANAGDIHIYAAHPVSEVAPIGRGQQLAEFNYEFQGGLYAQLINNPSFEEQHKRNDDSSWLDYWSVVKRGGGSEGKITAHTKDLLNEHQSHCLKLEISSVESGDVGTANKGFWGIRLDDKTKYTVSFWAKTDDGFSGDLKAVLESNDGRVYASQTFTPKTGWANYTCQLATRGVTEVAGTNRFAIYGTSTGTIYIDVVSVLPPTWKNRPHGLRRDLAEVLDAMDFQFIELPGGTNVRTNNMEYSYAWKNSIGPIEERPGSPYIRWGYKDMLYFGLDEMYQMVEDRSELLPSSSTRGILSSWRTGHGRRRQHVHLAMGRPRRCGHVLAGWLFFCVVSRWDRLAKRRQKHFQANLPRPLGDFQGYRSSL